MKIGILASHRWVRQNEPIFQEMVTYLEGKGHHVTTSQHTLEQLVPLTYVERETLFTDYYHKLLDCDLVLAECTLQSTQVGFGLAYLRTHGKPIIILSMKDINEMQTRGEVFSNEENLAVYEYRRDEIKSILHEALFSMEAHLDKRFTIIFPAGLMNKLEDISRKKKLPKSVYIRQLIEEDLANQKTI